MQCLRLMVGGAGDPEDSCDSAAALSKSKNIITYSSSAWRKTEEQIYRWSTRTLRWMA